MYQPKPQQIEIYDWDFGQCGQWDIDVEVFYTPEERGSRFEPGCDEQIEVVSIKYKGQDIGVLFESDETKAELEKAIKDTMREYYND